MAQEASGRCWKFAGVLWGRRHTKETRSAPGGYAADKRFCTKGTWDQSLLGRLFQNPAVQLSSCFHASACRLQKVDGKVLAAVPPPYACPGKGATVGLEASRPSPHPRCRSLDPQLSTQRAPPPRFPAWRQVSSASELPGASTWTAGLGCPRQTVTQGGRGGGAGGDDPT